MRKGRREGKGCKIRKEGVQGKERIYTERKEGTKEGRKEGN